MARCRCTNPCTCYFEYDGDRPNTIYKLPYENGRYSTRRKGTGTEADPYIVEFLDSEEFKVESGQARSTGLQTITSTTGTNGSFAIHLNQIDYETPNEIFLDFNLTEAHGTVHKFLPSAHRFWFISAQATFVYNGSVAGYRRLGIRFSGPSGEFGFDPSGGIASSTVVAGASSSGGFAEDITLSCSGLAPFMNGADSSFTNGLGGKVSIELMQGSGSNMTIRDIILTLVAL